MSLKNSNFIRFLKYVRPYAFLVALGALGGIVKFVLPLVIPYVVRHLLDNVFRNESLGFDEKLGELYFYLGGMALVFIFFYAPWTYIRHYCTAKAGHRSVFDLRCDLYYRILRMSASFFSRNKSGGIVSRLVSDIQLAQNLVGSALTNVWMDGALIVVVLILLFNIDAGVTLAAVSTFPIYLYFFRRIRGEIRSASHQVQQEIANLSGNVTEKISGSQVVHAFTQEKNEEKRFFNDSKRVFSTAMRTSFYQSINMMVTGTLTNIAPLIVLFYGGYRVITNQMSIGDLVAANMLLGTLYLPLQRFSELNVVFANSMAALDRIFEIMDEKPEITNRPDALDLKKIEGLVEFDHVDFSYDGGEAILRDISFTAPPGQKVALVGHSGSGKSTLVSLIPRFYDVDNGRILIDHHDIRDIRIECLRRHIAMVLQDPILFSGTIRENILYGNPKASDEEVLTACQAANAMEFIETLPKGFETEVGEKGVFLSGGQKQRLTIARAFLKNPQILVLDEPTSALDSESERMIQEVLERLMVGRTTFIIAHRLSTIVRADNILVIEGGEIVESGNHQNLLDHGGVYRALYEQQFESASAFFE
jgi:subfamily B ATP-binding cassette protein MsbA